MAADMTMAPELASGPLQIYIYIDLRSPYSYVFKNPMRAMAMESGA